MNATDYRDEALRAFAGLRSLAEKSLAQLDDRAFFAAPDPDSNSAAIVVKHMAGNMRSRWRDFLTTDGEKPDRHRDTEFELGEADDRAAIMAAWAAGWDLVEGAIAPLTEEDFARTVAIRGEPHTVLQAINRQLSHYAYHVGQIVYVAKWSRGRDWATLSIAKGASQAFNASPEKFLPPDDA
ncbi:DUF1572 family protein [bacterium]|nr:DUF1572 family protein [bacterium]